MCVTVALSKGLHCVLAKERDKVKRQPPSPVGTFFPSLALSLHPEGADVRSVSLVVGRGSGQPHEEVAGSLGLAHRSTCFCLPCGGKLGGGGGGGGGG